MIRIPSFFKRETQSDDLVTRSLGRNPIKRATSRTFQRAEEPQELSLTEDPEQQRARHRLVGAAVLVLLAVIGLPRILDNKPKAANNDIAVNIVTGLPIPSANPKLDERSKAAIPGSEVRVDEKAEVKADIKTEPKSATVASSKSPALGLADGEEVVATTSNAKPKVEVIPKSYESASAKSAIKYGIVIGSFATDDSIKNVTAKLKELKVPYSVSNKTRGDGVKLTIFRAGPYSDKDAAEAAEKKIKASLNPSAKITELGKQ
ncbi:SPOR domain-containing protein [Polynucleobacter sp. MWH-UH2A]|uniref:SPOR domain-containing protein n=1 Tax=Polynucleobacter sp. MWH-UH2A TaxID=1855617 RepID=UPI001BFE7825|nr:SPOR domain-containing protein [Polynucleobacter sp. MWH-UH2A]QWD63271.1 SPOR domain-containing protein [Polynucleobacter sp. MWH-UH2A]